MHNWEALLVVGIIACMLVTTLLFLFGYGVIARALCSAFVAVIVGLLLYWSVNLKR